MEPNIPPHIFSLNDTAVTQAVFLAKQQGPRKTLLPTIKIVFHYLNLHEI